jgi:uncharacterized membrane protein
VISGIIVGSGALVIGIIVLILIVVIKRKRIRKQRRNSQHQSEENLHRQNEINMVSTEYGEIDSIPSGNNRHLQIMIRFDSIQLN